MFGGQIRITCFVDADHAGDKLTRRSYTGIIIKLNGAVVFTFSKRQTTVEAATFGSERIASRIAKEKVQALLYKLRMMGVPGLFRLYVVIPPGFSDILVFPSPDFQRDKAWENRKNGRPPTVPPRLFKRQYESLPATRTAP